jgi:hypothetical protein
MGINRKDVELLIRLREQKEIPANSYVIELGAQQLASNLLTSENVVRKAEAAFGAVRPFALPAPPHTASGAGELLARDAPFARDFGFRSDSITRQSAWTGVRAASRSI